MFSNSWVASDARYYKIVIICVCTVHMLIIVIVNYCIACAQCTYNEQLMQHIPVLGQLTDMHCNVFHFYTIVACQLAYLYDICIFAVWV